MAVLVLVSSAMAVTGFSLLASGELIQIGIGIGVLLLVVVGVVLVAGEVQLGAASARLARQLDAEGGLPYDPPDVRRLPSGRLDKADADRVFRERRSEVEAAPEDCRTTATELGGSAVGFGPVTKPQTSPSASLATRWVCTTERARASPGLCSR